MMQPETRKRLLDIFLTALTGAFIAFLQGLLMGLGDIAAPAADPGVAAAAAGGIKSFAMLNKIR